MDELELFTEALNRNDPAERAAFLDQACAGNPKLLERIEVLLAGHDQSRSPLDRPPLASADFTENTSPATALLTGEHPPESAAATIDRGDTDATLTASRVPNFGATRNAAGEANVAASFGRYALVELIGQGGMGSVYRAHQTEPVKREVALKLIKSGMDSRNVLARFDAERQALALMDHPNIARIYDGGVTPAGQPFFVMELVHGVPLTDYCDQNHLSVKARLELFVSVCQAVQHAHQKGIIHRDLKPSNVLITEVDGRPTPKVIDFGVAKATEQRLTDVTLADTGAIVGTPAYMSPEQADPTSMDVDTRTDVYALGVILYELLTGSPPIEAHQFKRGAILEMLRMVREVDPPRPSTRLSTADALPNIAANRSIEPAHLANLLQGELDWVVMKALEKDRTRRYETANGFARDIQRYLADEVVEARPPSRGYRFKKFVKRNKVQVVAASLVLVTLVAGVVGTTVGLIEAKRQERLAGAHQWEAYSNLAFARKGNAILGSIFAGLDPEKIAESGRPLQDVLRQNLVKAVRELEDSAIGDPLDMALMQDTLGNSLRALGEFDLAVSMLEKALNARKAKFGPDFFQTLMSMGDLASAYMAAGRLDKALPLFEEAFRLSKAKSKPDNPLTVRIMGNLANGYQAAGKLDLALPLFEQTLAMDKAKLGPDHPTTLISMHNLANGYRDAGKLNLALPLFEQSLAMHKAKLGPDHPITLTMMCSLAHGYTDVGKVDLAVPLFEQTLTLRKTKLGPDHPSTLISMDGLARGYRNGGKLELALPLQEQTLALQKNKLGPDHPKTMTTAANLGVSYKDAGRLKEAIPLFEEALQSAKRFPKLRWVAIPLIDAYLKSGEKAKLNDLIHEQLAEARKTLPKDSPDLAGLLAAIGMGLLQQKNSTEAEPLLRECLAIREKTQPDLWPTFDTKSRLGGALLGQKKYAEAEPILLKGYEGMKQREKLVPPVNRSLIPEAIDRLIELYTATNKPDEVKKWQAERAKYPSAAPTSAR